MCVCGRMLESIVTTWWVLAQLSRLMERMAYDHGSSSVSDGIGVCVCVGVCVCACECVCVSECVCMCVCEHAWIWLVND